jgi:hypothetical protein
MYEITTHHSWASQGSKAVSIDRLKPFHAMYVDALILSPTLRCSATNLPNSFIRIWKRKSTPGRRHSNSVCVCVCKLYILEKLVAIQKFIWSFIAHFRSLTSHIILKDFTYKQIYLVVE